MDVVMLDRNGMNLSGEELENYCKRHGLCHLCAKVRTHKRVFRLLKKNESQALTIKNSGNYTVYKGYCLGPDCFTLEQAKSLLGEVRGYQRRNDKIYSFKERLKRGPASPRTSKSPLIWDSSDDNNGAKSFTTSSFESEWSNVTDSAKRSASDDEVSVVSVGSTMTTQSSVRRSLSQLLVENAGTILDLSYTYLHRVHIAELVSSMDMATSLNTLILENCKLNDGHAEAIAKGLFSSKTTPIAKLSLRSNGLGNSGAASFYAWLRENQTLEEFDLAKNQIGSKGAKKIVTGLYENDGAAIKILNLSHNEIWDINDGSFFEKNKTLEVLNLEGNFMHDEGIEAIAKGIQANEQTALKRLFLGWNGIGDVGVSALANMLEFNSSMATLGLVENEVTNVGARALLSALSMNSTLQEITGLNQNKIDRRFIVAAIQRLLRTRSDGCIATPSTAAGLTDILEESQSAIEPRIEPIEKQPIPEGSNSELDWADKLYTPVGATNPPIVEIKGESSASAAESSKKTTKGQTDELRMAAVQNEKSKVEAVITQESATPQKSGRDDGQRQVSPVFLETSINNEMQAKLQPEQVEDKDPALFDRLTVFQSAPLAYFNRETSLHHAIPLQDFDFESSVLDQSLNGSPSCKGTIEVEVEDAISEKLGSFLSQPRSRVMHLSCYGHSEYLAFENGLGYVDSIAFDSLPKLLKDRNLQVVVILSKYAREIGNAFIEAGVPHVVCCPHAEAFRDVAAMEFIARFYRALALRKTLKKAFAFGRQAAQLEPIARHVERYFLLPDKADDDDYHDVPVFFSQPVPPRAYEEDPPECLRFLPQIPQNFTGREVDMYEILEALRADDVVRVGGPVGSGKTTVVAAVCRYILRRSKSFQYDDIYWLPPPDGVIAPSDSLYGDLKQCIELIVDSEHNLWEQEAALDCRDRIEIELEGRRTILVIDSRRLRSEASSQNLEDFLSHLLNVADVKIILIASRDGGDSSKNRQEGETTLLGPLDFKSTALLFGEVSRFITCNGCPAAQSPEEFSQLVAPPSVAKLQDESKFSCRRRTELMSYMGNGIPRIIIESATRMPAEDFINLIGIGNRPEIQVDSYGALETEYRRWSKMRSNALRAKNYLRGGDLESILEELDDLRSNFPTLDDLLERERILQEKLQTAHASRQYGAGTDIKRQILALKKLIIHEKRADPGRNGLLYKGSEQVGQIQAQVQSIVRMTESFSCLDTEMPKDDAISASFTFSSAKHQCSLRIYNGSVVDFQPFSAVSAIVCWTNECCDLANDDRGATVLDCGGPGLSRDIESLPAISTTPWGEAKCGTGNAVVVGPGAYGGLKSPCIVLAVGPMSPSCNDECNSDEEDRLHYMEIMMRSCYRSCLVLAKYSNLKEIAFPTLTTKLGGDSYRHTLQLGFKILVEEAKFSALSMFHLVASSNQEASRLIDMASELGLSRV